MPIDFTASDVAEARRVNAGLDRLPRFTMETWVGRVVLNGMLRVTQLHRGKAARDARVTIERRTIRALDRAVKLRIVRTARAVRGVVFDIHGGGFTIGNAKMDDYANAELALERDIATVSVDYVLALGQPISESVADCVAAALWTLDNAEAEFGQGRVLLSAKSAGATLAASMLLKLRDEHDAARRFIGAMLFFGLYDFSGQPSVRAAGSDTLLLHVPRSARRSKSSRPTAARPNGAIPRCHRFTPTCAGSLPRSSWSAKSIR